MLVGITITLLALAAAGYAYPNLSATTGVVGTPTADVVGQKVTDWAADLLFFDTTTGNGRVIYGVTDRLEVGGALILGNDTGFDVGAKYKLYTIPRSFSWAVGGILEGANHERSGSQWYVVATKPISSRKVQGSEMQASLGLNYTDIDSGNGLRPFLNVQLFFGADTEISGEYQFKNGDKFGDAITSAVFRQRFSGRWTAEIGLTNATGFMGSDDTDVFAGISYAVSPGK